jgi:hypothetical protein
MWHQDPYFVANDVLGVSGPGQTQTIYACSYSDWYVVASMDNHKGNHVESYPNSHRDFDSEPKISSFNSITSTFAVASPDSGIYEDAYDIWLNGIGWPESTEVMIWTYTHGQAPGGSDQATVTIGGESYTVWRGRKGTYIAFVANSGFTSATMNLLDFLRWLVSEGWVAGNATLGQVDYGAEVVSTNGVPATFAFSNFSVNTS